MPAGLSERPAQPALCALPPHRFVVGLWNAAESLRRSIVMRDRQEQSMNQTVFRMLDEAARQWANDPYALRKTDSGYAPTTFIQAREKARQFGA